MLISQSPTPAAEWAASRSIDQEAGSKSLYCMPIYFHDWSARQNNTKTTINQQHEIRCARISHAHGAASSRHSLIFRDMPPSLYASSRPQYYADIFRYFTAPLPLRALRLILPAIIDEPWRKGQTLLSAWRAVSSAACRAAGEKSLTYLLLLLFQGRAIST